MLFVCGFCVQGIGGGGGGGGDDNSKLMNITTDLADICVSHRYIS